MALDLVPRKLLSFPSLSLPDFWDDDEGWLTSTSSSNGLSVYEDDNSVYVEAALPGVDPKDIDITFQDGYLWVRAETEEKEEGKRKKYYHRATRSFSYRVAVPGDVDDTKEPDATYKNGVMTITFTKSPKAQPKKIQVKAMND